MFFGNRVLNVIDFKHPGPQKLISDAFNTDITEDYIDQSHSKYADTLLHNMTVGYLPDSKNEHKRLHNEHYQNGLSKEEEEIHNWLDKTIDLKKALLP
jgi:cytochrome b involved in lipid metabolism